MSNSRRRGLIAVLLVLVAGLAAVAALRGPSAPPTATLLRDRPVMAIPPLALPTGDPLSGPEGAQPDGTPLRFVDRAGVLALLRADRFAQLTAFLEARQAALEADVHQEDLLVGAADAFSVADPTLAPHLDAWVAATPASFAPWLARAEFWLGVASARRGTAFVAKTSETQLDDMARALALAVPDAQRALQLHPRLAQAHWVLLWRAAYLGEAADLATEQAAAIEACPACLGPRVAALLSSSPRWGGSHEAQLRLAAAAPTSLNPRFAVLPGYVALDESRVSPDLAPALHLATIEKACALGEHWDFLLERARALRRLDRLEEAARDLARAHALKPGHPSVREGELRQLLASKAWRRAAELLVEGLGADPTSASLRAVRDRLVERVVVDAWAAHERGEDRLAIDLLDLAVDLDPDKEDTHLRRNTVLDARVQPSPAALAEQKRRLQANPDDLRARRTFDAAQSQLGRWPEIRAMWDDYLAAHPDDARALVERSGTLYRLQDFARSLADAERACRLGAWEGCDRAEKVRPHVPQAR